MQADSWFMEFPPVSEAEWEAAVRADLKGNDPGSLGKILYHSGDAPAPVGEQPWPATPWKIWAEVSDLPSAERALQHGAEGLVVKHPGPDWLPLLSGTHLHTSAAEQFLIPWAEGLTGTIEADRVSNALPGFRAVHSIPHDLPIVSQIRSAASVPSGSGLIVPVGSSYFEEIAKFRALRRLRPRGMLIARTSRWHATAYAPLVNVLRGTSEAMAAIIGGCEALIIGPFTEARGPATELGDRLALNTQLLLREEAFFGTVADPAAGSWYVEWLTSALLSAHPPEIGGADAFIGVNRYPAPDEMLPTEFRQSITEGRAMSALESCRARSDSMAERAGRRPSVLVVLGTDARVSKGRATFTREFFLAGGFEVSENIARPDLAVLCDADENYPALAAKIIPSFHCPVLLAGPELSIAGIAGCINRQSDQAASITGWQQLIDLPNQP